MCLASRDKDRNNDIAALLVMMNDDSFFFGSSLFLVSGVAFYKNNKPVVTCVQFEEDATVYGVVQLFGCCCFRFSGAGTVQ